MASYTYSVRDAGGSVVTGALTAESRVDALNNLRNRNLFVIDLVEQDIDAPVHGANFALLQRVKLTEMAIFTRQFASMIGAGISVTRCLATLAKQQRNQYFSKLLLAVKNDVASGLPLSASMAKYPRIFNSLMISLLVSAEETGTMDTTLEQLADTFEAEVALRHEISAGTRYPLIVGIAAILVVAFVMIMVVPQFDEIFRSLGAELPLMTKIVVMIALFMKKFWWLLPVLLLGIPWLFNLISSTPGGRYVLDSIKLKLPVFGSLLQKVILSRMSRVFSTLLSAGVPILKALTIVEQTSLNAVYERSIAKVRDLVKEGRDLSGPLESFPSLYPPMVTAMIAVGEESGTLDHMLLKINDFYTKEVEAMVKKLTALLEPVLIGTLGVIIGFIVVALWMPLFRVIQLIQELD